MEGIKKYRKIIYVITDFLACVCFNSFFSVRTTDFTNNILAILFFACGYLLQNAAFKRVMQLRKWICCGIGGAFFCGLSLFRIFNNKNRRSAVYRFNISFFKSCIYVFPHGSSLSYMGFD